MLKGMGGCLTVSWSLPSPGSHTSNPSSAFLGVQMGLFPAARWQRGLSQEQSNRGCTRKGHSNLCSDSQQFISLLPLQPGKIASKLASPWRSIGLPQCCGNGREDLSSKQWAGQGELKHVFLNEIGTWKIGREEVSLPGQ